MRSPAFSGCPLAAARWSLPALAVVCLIQSGCSIRKMAIGSLADSFASGGTSVYLSDDDPVLVGEALPFSLKLMETLLQERPEHRGLLVATAGGFVSYGQMYVLRPSRVLETTDLRAGRKERARSKALFLRARGYAGRALELGNPGILQGLFEDPDSAASGLQVEDVPAMYWYAAALGSAVSADKNDMSLVAELPTVRALLERAIHLDESWNDGALHEAMISFAMGGGLSSGDPGEEAEHHFRRAMELNGGSSMSPHVAMAESVCVQEQDRACFIGHLTRVLEFDVEAHPDTRLVNALARRHAEWLLARIEELFIQDSAAGQRQGFG